MVPVTTLTSFIDAVNRGDLAAVTNMLAMKPALARATDADGATALHHAAFSAQHDVVDALLKAGADLNARDGTFDATPGGWALHRLRERGALLAIEIDDVVYALERGDVDWVRRFVTRHPALATACDREGRGLADHPRVRSTPELANLFAVPRSRESA
jgi:hypothetical protein